MARAMGGHCLFSGGYGWTGMMLWPYKAVLSAAVVHFETTELL